MSKSKLAVGVHIRIEYKDKWYRAKIIEMTDHNIVIKLWKSPFKTKLFDIPRRPNWINLVLQSKIYTDNDNKGIPKFCKIGKNICIFQSDQIMYYKVADIYQSTIVLYGLRQNKHNQSKLITRTIDCNKDCKLTPSSDKHYYRNICSYPRFLIYRCPHSINNEKLLKNFLNAKKNKKDTKSTSHQIVSSSVNNKQSYLSQFIYCLSNRYTKAISECNAFPIEVKQLMLSFLVQPSMYICPDTPCKMHHDLTDTDMYYGYQFSVNFAMLFRVNMHLWIIGIEISFDNVINEIIDDTIYLIDHENNDIIHKAIASDSDDRLFNVEYYFDQPIELKPNNHDEARYKLGFAAKANLDTKFTAHDMSKKEFKHWKCFEWIKWTQVHDMDVSSKKKFKRYSSDSRLPFYPHISFLLA